MQVFEQRAPVNTVERQVIPAPSGPPPDVHSGEYVRRLESEINLLREKLHYEQSQREDTAEVCSCLQTRRLASLFVQLGVAEGEFSHKTRHSY